MPLAHANDGDLEDGLFVRLDNARTLQDAVQVLAGAGAKTADVELNAGPRGLRLSVCTQGSLIASVVLPARMFTVFRAEGPSVRVNLSLLADCLAAPTEARPTAATLAVAPDAVRLSLVEADSTSQSQLRTISGESGALESLREAQGEVVASAIVRSDAMRDTLAELDYGGADTVALRISPKKPHFMFSAPPGSHPTVQIEFPNPNDPASDAFDEFQCENTVSATYKLETLQRIGKALAASDVSKVTVDDNGSLSVVCKMKGGISVGSDQCFVEFLIIAQEVEDQGVEQNEGSGDSDAAVEDEMEQEHDDDDEDGDEDDAFW